MKSGPNIRDISTYTVISFLLTAIYFYVAQFSLIITKTPGQSSAFFIPSGLAVGILVFFGARYLPVIFIAKFILGLVNDRGLYLNLISCLASVSEAYIGLYLYQAFKDIVEEYFEYQSTLISVSIVALFAPIFSALIGVTNLYYLGVIAEDMYFSHFATWYIGDVLSILIILPAFLSFKDTKHRFFDFIAPFAAFAITYIFKFHTLGPYLFFIFLAILLPCLLGTIQGIYYALITVSLVLNWFLIGHDGPFAVGNYQENMTSIQFFLFALGISALALEGFKKTRLIKSAIAPLLAFWVLTGSVYYYYYSQRELDNARIITSVIDDFENRLIEKMVFYENAIKGASGFVSGSEKVEPDEWDAYAKSISIVDQINGIKGIGVIYPKSTSNRPALIYPDHLNATGNFEKIIYHPELRELFEQSIYRNNPILTPAIQIDLFGGKKAFTSFLITTIKKRDRFIGWIVAAVEMESFFKSLAESRYQQIDIDIYDGDNSFLERKVYTKIVDKRLRNSDNSHPKFSTLNLADRTFTIDWNETLRYITGHGSQNSMLILVGSLFSLLITGFILNLKLISEKANKIAGSKTMELRESEERFKSLFENSSDAVILFNNNEIIDCNPESLVLFGKRSKKDLINSPLYDFFAIRDLDSTEDKELFRNKVREVKYKKMVKFECFCLRGALPFFAEMHLHYIEVNDKFIYQAVVRDISERKKIEQNLTKSKELAEDAARAKSNFLSTMSHEIRTPLNGVIGMINIILEENPKSEIREDLETIKYSADNLLHIVNEVLDYTKIESGKIVLEKKVFSLRSLCENVLKIHRPKAMEKNLKLSMEIDQKVPDLVIGDEYRNTQILNNLLSNSLKFTNEGEVNLYVRLKQKKEDSCIIEFKVSDTGIGIDKDKQREIFKDFTQAESDHTRKYGGTGLGLAITKRLVEIQNGKIDVTSGPKSGTTFVFTIHFAIKSEQPMSVTSNSPQKIQESFQGQRVLLVEDNQVNIIVTKKFLEKWGLKVDVAINGLEAVNHVRAIKYDLILMDLHMPLMDGFEATKKIREFNKETPIIGLSADVMTESVSSLQSIGMNDFVTKPFRPNDFFIKLKSYF